MPQLRLKCKDILIFSPMERSKGVLLVMSRKLSPAPCAGFNNELTVFYWFFFKGFLNGSDVVEFYIIIYKGNHPLHQQA